MNTPDSQAIVRRFFVALDYLKGTGAIRGRQTFTREHNINRWNMNTCEKHPESNMFQAAWLSYLVHDYGISARWLLTGLGNIDAGGK